MALSRSSVNQMMISNTFLFSAILYLKFGNGSSSFYVIILHISEYIKPYVIVPYDY